MAKYKYFGKRIDPACSHCLHAHTVKGSKKISCQHSGFVEPFHSCRLYEYDPIKRVPTPHRFLPDFESEDFKV